MNKCRSIDLLKNNKLKVTKQRELLLDEIINIESVFSANTLHQILRNQMDLATIYRILIIFKDHKLIREVTAIDDTKYYEISCIHHPIHPHYICKKCNKLFCLKNLNEKDIINLKKYTDKFSVDEMTIQFYGTCSKCK